MLLAIAGIYYRFDLSTLLQIAMTRNYDHRMARESAALTQIASATLGLVRIFFKGPASIWGRCFTVWLRSS